jgi:cbb3-type cytochrome oxidase subunit 3
MIYTFLGVLVAAIAIGMTIGGCLILCCLKVYSRGQQKRLATANRGNLRFTEGNETEFNARTMPCAQTIPDEEKPNLRPG